MSRGTNQKFKLYYLSRIMLEKTDDEHGLTIHNIKDELEKYGVTADRKSLYTDLQDLERLGFEVLRSKSGWDTYYRLGAKPFEVAEIKVLIDLIQSAQSLSEHISAELIRKLERFVSQHEASALNRQVRLWNRGKTSNETMLYNVDAIHRAMYLNQKIRFRYIQSDNTEERVLNISPWELFFEANLYYMTCYDGTTRTLVNFLVEAMRDVDLTEELREGEKCYKEKKSELTFGERERLI